LDHLQGCRPDSHVDHLPNRRSPSGHRSGRRDQRTHRPNIRFGLIPRTDSLARGARNSR
jgi:hypothetical protein